MNVIGLDGKTYRLKYGKIRENCSSGHERARLLLKEQFPFYHFYEESYVDGGPTKLYLDFFNPKLKIAVEVNGRQHYEFVAYLHGTLENFRKQQKRDRQKLEWAELNGIKLIGLADNGTDSEWRKAISDGTIGECGKFDGPMGD